MKVLIVEDERNVAGTLQRALSQKFGSQTEVVVCRVGEIALSFLQSGSFDLLITDWHLPGISGLVLISKARKSYPSLKIVFMAASHLAEIKERVKGVADLYITKPFQVSVLLEKVQGLL